MAVPTSSPPYGGHRPMALRSPRLPTPPSNPYGAHPGAGWAPPPGPADAQRAAAARKRILIGAVLAFLALVYVVPLCSRLF
ncbi:hypothetical protein ABZ820_06915 [Streptomyces diacarni]|uniref:hypothetical protein n=1 Tax=Streptomyces diacarni TaxID=2800381 RepID=UPI0034099307